jgi:hypothetical protein
VDLEGADILQLKTIGGPTEIPAQMEPNIRYVDMLEQIRGSYQ